MLEIDVIEDEIPYIDFFNKFIKGNRPCILSEHFTKEWKSRKEWVTEEGTPNFELLNETFGSAKVPVADCKTKHYNSQQKIEMLLSGYITYWRTVIESSYDYDKHDQLYLKDWHIVKEFPTYEAYTVPEYFKSDWLNEFWSKRSDVQDDYRFVYMGPTGTWTPFHSDVFNSFSWSANICGRKKWFLFPPGQEACLRNKHGALAYDVTSNELTDQSKYPRFSELQHRIEVIQEPGQVIFIPSRWHHQVHNLDDTISINHNWVNGCNLRTVWNALLSVLEDVEKEIEDCKDMDSEEWYSQCQIILKALFGMDYFEFFYFLDNICDPRIESLRLGREALNNRRVSTFCHNEMDLLYVKDIINEILNSQITLSEELQNLSAKLLSNIEAVISENSQCI